MRFWHTALVSISCATLFLLLTYQNPSFTNLVAGVMGFCLVLAIVDGVIFGVGAIFKSHPSWLTLTLVNVFLVLLAVAAFLSLLFENVK